MEPIYWMCLSGGILLALVTVVFGDMVSNAVHGALDFMSLDGLRFLQPMVIGSVITVFGGAGLMLEHYYVWAAIWDIAVAILASLVIGWSVYVFYVRPMMNSENSTGFSIHDLTGKIGEVLVPIPARGYGEVLVRVGAANTNQIAASFDGQEFRSGERIVVVEVKDDTLYVSRLE
ncbi:protease [Paenibacillus koleovorans]|uniref:protease n=1 Tax=Paenibacillus koleovorans TaxID=121608 RepID=UPI000FDB2708|nr:protease [Paenibacillus koleovorans]